MTSSDHQRSVYEKWAAVYDALYAGIFAQTQNAVARFAFEAGPRILEIGVGTGLAFDFYPPSAAVIGIDLTLPMLRRAQAKVNDNSFKNVTGFCMMDATRLGFADNSFDAVAYSFVLALIPDMNKALQEARRVVRPGGRIVIGNKFGAEDGWLKDGEEWLDPHVKKIGWTCAFKASRVAAWAINNQCRVAAHKKGVVFQTLALEKIG